MKIYLAARFSRNDEMRGVRDVLETMGHQITSRWIDLHGGDQLESAAQEVLNSDPESVAHFPRENIFHTLPQVEHCPDWSRLALAFSSAHWAERGPAA